MDKTSESRLGRSLLAGVLVCLAVVMAIWGLTQRSGRGLKTQNGEILFYNEDGSGYLLFKSGKTMTFSEKVTCSATAYSIGDWTASGLPTKVGHIAVDTDIFPYHTRFYIYTNDGYLVYGNAVAADCGTSIKGYKIDLYFDTVDECWEFGVRSCTAYIIQD